MKLEFAFLADAGFAQNDTGLFSVINGGVNIVYVSQFPGGVHALALLGRASFEPAECGKTHLIDVHIVAPDGTVQPGFHNVQLTPQPNILGSDRVSFLTLVFTFQSLIFPISGVYTFRITHSDRALGELGAVAVDVIQQKGSK